MYGIDALSDPQLIGGPGFDMLGDAVEWAESRGRDNALGPVTRSGERAVGPMQLMRAATIDYLMANGLPADPETVAAMQRDPQKNREIGRWYLRQQYDRFGGDTDKALAAYNWGPARVQRLGDQFSVDRTPAETQKYIQSIRGRLGEQPAPQGEAPMRDDSDPDAALESLMNYQPRQMASQGLAAFAGQQRPQAPQGGQPMQGLDALNPAMQLAGQLMPQRRGMDWTDALMQGGAAMMASRRPDFLGALGEGVGRGHQTFMAGEDQRYKDQVDRMGLGLKLHTAMQKDTSPIKLGEGEQLIDRNTLKPIAGNPKYREPKLRSRTEGDQEIQEEGIWNGAMTEWREIGRGPRWQAEKDGEMERLFKLAGIDRDSPEGKALAARILEKKAKGEGNDGPFPGSSVDAATYNIIVAYNEKLARREPTTSAEDRAYDLALERAARPDRWTTPTGEMFEKPGLDVSKYAPSPLRAPGGPTSAPSAVTPQTEASPPGTPPGTKKVADAGDKPASGESAGKFALIPEGRDAIAQAEKAYFGEKGFDRGMAAQAWARIPGKGEETYNALWRAIANRLRIETGAAAPDAEVKKMMDRYTPKPWDSEQTARQKLDGLKQYFDAFEKSGTVGPRRAMESSSTQQPTAVPPKISDPSLTIPQISTMTRAQIDALQGRAENLSDEQILALQARRRQLLGGHAPAADGNWTTP